MQSDTRLLEGVKAAVSQNHSAPEKAVKDDANAWEDSRPWPSLSELAYHGLAGEFARTLWAHSEAHPFALIAPFLCMFGCAAGPSPHVMVEATKHPARIYPLLVGATAGGRKGTALEHVKRIYRIAEADWLESSLVSGLASGEGLIAHLDSGNKSALVSEPEFTRTLTAASRDGSILSHIMRDAYDSDRLQSITRKSPLTVSGVHVSIIAKPPAMTSGLTLTIPRSRTAL